MSPSPSENGTESPVKRQKTSHDTAKEEGSTTLPCAESCTTTTTTTTNSNSSNNNSNNNHPTPHYYHPNSIVTWNCNGFSTRAKHNRDQLKLLVRSTGEIDTDTDTGNYAGGPDVICIQEARLKAEGPGEQRGRLLKDNKDYPDVAQALEEAFGDYRPFFSLADTKYAGTLTLIRKSCLAKATATTTTATTATATTATTATTTTMNNFVAFTFYSAIELILRRLGTTRSECGLPEMLPPDEEPPPKPAKVRSAPVKKKQPTTLQKQQKTLTSFFAFQPKPKAAAPPPPPKLKPKVQAQAAKATPSPGVKSSNPHNHQGRFQFFFFPGMDLIQTYVPNNGTKDESFAKRKQWDADMKQFVRDRAQILEACSQNSIAKGGGAFDASVDRKLLWCGDMNASLSYRDGTHWQKRNRNNNNNNNGGGGDDNDGDGDGGDDDSGVYEWFRDTSVCFPPGSENAKNLPALPENRGMPGFTQAERKRFAELVKEGDFCDLWREQHPGGVSVSVSSDGRGSSGSASSGSGSRWGRPDYTWRGQLSRNPGVVARYEGKAMRLDYFLLAPARIGVSAVATKRRQIGAESTKRQGPRELVADCKIRGHGTRMEGLFCGSDHSAVELKLYYTSD